MSHKRTPQKNCRNGLRGLIFDVDGVLFNSRTSNIEFYNLIRRAVGLPLLTPEEENFCHMASSEEVLTRTIPEELRYAAVEAAEAINYQEKIQPLLTLEEGVLEALYWLEHWRVPMAVCTNRTNSVSGLLHAFGLEKFFPIVMTAQSHPPKPDPGGLLAILDAWNIPPRAVAFLGDSKVDEQAAKSAGIPFWAFRNPELTTELHFSSFFELISWLTPFVEDRPDAIPAKG